MISKYDISKLQDLPIEQVAEALRLKVHRHKSLCPFHADSRPSLTFCTRRNRYRCYVCDAHGGTIDLVMHTQGWDFNESCQWLARQFNILLSDHSGCPAKPLKEYAQAMCDPSRATEKPDIEYLSRLMCQPVINPPAAQFLYHERKIRSQVVRQLGLSSIAYSCPMSSSPKTAYFDGPALLIPYRDIDGNLISVQSRYLGTDDKVRFKFPKGSTCHVFNIDCLKGLSPHEPLFITEGVSDCLALLSAGFASIAIPSATLLKEEDIQHLQGRKLHIYPDADAPGEKLFLQLRKHFPDIHRHQLPQGFKDIGQYYAYIHRNDAEC